MTSDSVSSWGGNHLLSKDGATRIDEIERDDEVVRELLR
jgi:hypothetical protein